ncbi:protein of unknown function [Psychroflexus sediminis]|uniref:DUF4271 domain-containing protein n=1 Tax=Psychroflexus sediminis TaxID=470826 RepID=A0A1G7U1D9_9FLAO|nr:protein of unknown function [Psychroflexus sediminis]
MFLALRPVQNHHWVIGITLFILILLVVLKWNKDNYIVSFGSSLFNSSFYSRKFIEKRRIDLSEVLVFIASLFGISFFVFVILSEGAFSSVVYLQILFLATFILLSKYLIEKIIGDLFELDQLVGRYLFYKQGVLSWLSLFFLFPAGLLLYFQNIDNSSVVYAIAGVLISIYVYKLFSFIRLYQKHILSYWFYFILYLCAFEIAPYLIILKFLKSIN